MVPKMPGNRLEIDRPPAPRETAGLGSEKHLLLLPSLRNARGNEGSFSKAGERLEGPARAALGSLWFGKRE